MALDGTRLGTAIAAAVASASSGISPTAPVTQEQIDAIWIAVGTAIIAEITANAEVPGITPGGGSTVVT